MRGLSRFLADVVFDGAKGEAFSVVLVILVVAGAIVLILNMAVRPRKPQAPKPAWEAVPDDEPDPAPPAAVAPRSAPKTAPKPAPARRKA